jgi:hypothetical protein
MIKHPFNKSWYDKYDNVAKQTLVQHLQEKGHTVGDVKEDYNVDVVSTKEDYTYFNEAEVKRAWKGDWPTHWAEIRIPERKKRLVEMYKKEKGVLNFYVFRADLKQVFRIKDTSLTPDRLKEAVGRYIREGEKFFHVPYTEAELINLA